VTTVSTSGDFFVFCFIPCTVWSRLQLR